MKRTFSAGIVILALYLFFHFGAMRSGVKWIENLNGNGTDSALVKDAAPLTTPTLPNGTKIGAAAKGLPAVFGIDTKPVVAYTTTTVSSTKSTTAVPVVPVDLNPTGAKPGLPTIATNDARAQATAIINQVRTAGRGPKTGYTRDQFGPAWTDNNNAGLWSHNGCDTRDDILRRDLTGISVRPNTNNCVVVAGTLADPYTAKTYVFAKATASKLQVDHEVPLSLAWQMGASRWDKAKRTAFANDPLNLVLTDGPTNGAKSDSSIASWMPPNRTIRCAYALRIAQVSIRYDLPTTAADKAVMITQCAPR